MKNILKSKISKIAIVLSFSIILLLVTVNIFVTSNRTSNTPNIQDLNTVYGGNGDIHFSDDDVQSMMTEDSLIAQVYMSAVVNEWSDVKEIKNIDHFGDIYFDNAVNLSQDIYCKLLKIKYNIQADNTCSLIATIIAMYVISDINDNVDYGYTSNVASISKIDMLKDLYDISTKKYGNTYDKNALNSGTYPQTISGIITDYFESKGIDLDSSWYQFYSDAMTKIGKMGIPLYIIGIKNFVYDEQLNKGTTYAAHSVTGVGLSEYTITYTKGLLNRKQEKPFTIYIICDGMSNSDTGEFGRNFQYLILRNNAEVNLYTFNDWLNY